MLLFTALTLSCLVHPAPAGIATLLPVAMATPPPLQEPADPYARSKGKLEWFEGSWEELLAEAKKSERLIFLDFYAEWCVWCKRLDKDVFSHEVVVGEMKDLLCYAVDVESKAGKPIAKRYHVDPLPTLLFLEPNGDVREVVVGFMTASPFLEEVKRIKRNEGTLGALRERIEKEPTDLDARYELGMKLQKIGDQHGYEKQVQAIRELDPEGLTVASRRLTLDEILASTRNKPDPQTLYAFVAVETDPDLLFRGWYAIYHVEGTLAAKRSKKRAFHRECWVEAARKLWHHTPEMNRGSLGNAIAWNFYEARAELGPDELAFALDVARDAVKILPNDPNVVDTLACCLFATGARDEALLMIKRCIELDPQNPEWKKRLEDFLDAGGKR